MAKDNELTQEEYNAIVFEDGDSLVVDMTNVQEMKFDAIPKGIYDAEIDECTFGKSKSSGAAMFTIVWVLTGEAREKYGKRKFYHFLSFSPKALGGTKTQLMRLDPTLFAGQFQPQKIADEGVLLGRQMKIKLDTEEYQGEDRNRVSTIVKPSASGEGSAASAGNSSFFSQQ